MDIQNKRILILGGWGLVGSAVCHRLMKEHPRKMIITSLRKEEAVSATAELRKSYPRTRKNFFVPWWGNIFVRHSLKDIPREEILGTPRYRRMMMDDILSELTAPVLKRSSLYRLMELYRPDIVVDCVNSATAIAYQDLFSATRAISEKLAGLSSGRRRPARRGIDDLVEATERLVCTFYIPQLIRHVQLMYRSMSDAGTSIYVKIGTSGTGGMGLNIPYTHSEERPSRVLLSKSAVAGAHTLLLFLMARTPDAPITKEIKPTAAIAWKRIGYGQVLRGGRPIPLFDCPPGHQVKLGRSLRLRLPGVAKPLRETLRSVFIDTGENGIFSRGEFEAISTPGQMEYVTPEEIAENTVFEIRAGNTGHDVINALDNATLAPTYRAGFMFNSALRQMEHLEKEHGVSSVAFEMLGPPRLSKLLYEAHLLKLCFGTFSAVVNSTAAGLSRTLAHHIGENTLLRAQVISIGIPILLPDGRSLLRAETIKIPPDRGKASLPVTSRQIDLWAHDGWVDLRPRNMTLWQKRLRGIMRSVRSRPKTDTSSREMYNKKYWNDFAEIDPGKLCGWIFSYEEEGKRMKA